MPKNHENFLGYLERRPFYFQIFDSPGVKLYHFAGISIFRQSNCTLFGTDCAPRFSGSQPKMLKL